MATTFQQLIDRARYTLKDDDKIRYPDAEMLVYANLYLGTLRRDRPDAFVGLGLLGATLTTYVIGDTFPLSTDFEQPLIDYAIGRAEAKNAESGDEGRAAGFFGLANAGTK